MQNQAKQRPRGITAVGVSVLLALLAALLVVTGGHGTERPHVIAPAGESEEGGRVSVFHNPPLLVLPNEPVVLSFDVICAAEDPTDGCAREGVVHVRGHGQKSYETFDLLPTGDEHGYRLFAPLPPRFSEAGGFTYYAELGSSEDPILVPAGGHRAPHRAWVLEDPESIALGPQSFEPDRDPDAVALSGPWGEGPGEFGIEPGDESLPIGPSSFDVASDGTVYVMDAVNRRLVVGRSDGKLRHVPTAVTSALPDIARDAAGNIHVLESSAPDGGTPPLRMFAPDGTLLRSTRIAEPVPSKVRIGLAGPYVYQYPSAMWMPVLDEVGRTLSLTGQIRRELPGLLDDEGFATVVKVTDRELRVATVDIDGSHVARSWRISAPPSPPDAVFGEVQLAEVVGGELVVAVAVHTDTEDAFRVLRIAEETVLDDFTVDRAAYTETASVSRFRLGPDGHLYQIRSSESGAEIVLFGLGKEER